MSKDGQFGYYYDDDTFYPEEWPSSEELEHMKLRAAAERALEELIDDLLKHLAKMREL